MVQLLDSLCSVSWLPSITSIATITVEYMLPIRYFKWNNNEEKMKVMKVVTTLLTMIAIPFFFFVSYHCICPGQCLYCAQHKVCI